MTRTTDQHDHEHQDGLLLGQSPHHDPAQASTGTQQLSLQMPMSKSSPQILNARCLAIVPAFNEEESIASVVEQIADHLPHFDVLVIDDGSIDGTAACVPRSARLIRLPFNMGIGSAMQTGYRFAHAHGYDVAVQVDADGQHPPSQVGKLVEALLADDVDMIVGSRFLTTIEYRQAISRMVGIHWLRKLVKFLTGQWITDPTSGFRAANARVIAAFAHWYPDDYPEPEVVLLLHRAGFTIKEVQVEMVHRQAGQTSIPLVRGLFYVIKVSLALILDMVRQPWPHHLLTQAARQNHADRAASSAPSPTSTLSESSANSSSSQAPEGNES